MRIIHCNESFAAQILDIFNDAIINTTALYEYKLRDMEFMSKWFEEKKEKDLPVIGLVNDSEKLLGFGTYGTFRARAAYKYTIEHSVYIHKDHRSKGYGKILLGEIIKQAQQQDYHCIVGAIDASNTSSIELHKKFGFEFSGRIKQSAYKFDKWLDLDFYQLLLHTPEFPKGK